MHFKTFLLCFIFLHCIFQVSSNKDKKPSSTTSKPGTTPKPGAKGSSTKAPAGGGAGANGTSASANGTSTSKPKKRPVIAPRIFGGRPAQPEEFPYQLQMLVRGHHTCGATLVISPSTGQQIGLTAAHCVYQADPADFSIKAGSLKISDPEAQDLKVRQFITHENYNGNYLDDIALIIFDGQFQLGGNVKPLDLPQDENVEPKEITVSGFGWIFQTGQLPEYLQAATLKVIPQQKCQELYGPQVKITKAHLCAGDYKGQTTSCRGDSGGPAMAVDRNGNMYVAGVVSFGPTQCASKQPGVYSRTSKFLQFISQNSGASDVNHGKGNGKGNQNYEYYEYNNKQYGGNNQRGAGAGNGYGTGAGNGYGTGAGNGYGTGAGAGNGYGTGAGNGYGTGAGNVYGTGAGTGNEYSNYGTNPDYNNNANNYQYPNYENYQSQNYPNQANYDYGSGGSRDTGGGGIGGYSIKGKGNKKQTGKGPVIDFVKSFSLH